MKVLGNSDSLGALPAEGGKEAGHDCNQSWRGVIAWLKKDSF